MVLNQGLNDWNSNQGLPYQDQVNSWKNWLEMAEKARKYDELTKQPNCEDPAKEHIYDQVLKRLEELEKKIDGR